MVKSSVAPCVLIVDDDRTVVHLATRALETLSVSVSSAATAAETRAALTRGCDVVLLDVMLPDATGIDLFREIQELDSKLPVIFITATNDSETAIEAIKLGAFDYVLKPIDLNHLEGLVRQALEMRRLVNVPVRLQPEEVQAENDDLMIGGSRQMLEVYKTIGRVASRDIPVLIMGESGTGKELVARAIYQHGSRAGGPFLALNCAAIPENLLESELFGHEKGSFTGAAATRIGKFEQCTGGTIFLDEIGDMPPLLQSKILRVLQEGTIERVGSNKTIQTDVRVVAATHRDLESMVAEGKFRSDLYYRLNGVTIHLPPLRERKDDLNALVSHLIQRYRREFQKDIQGISPEALQLLDRYSWPGNIRELQSALRLAVVQATGSILMPEFFPKELTQRPESATAPNNGPDPAALEAFIQERIKACSEDLYQEAVSAMELKLLSVVLRHTGGNQSRAAKMLGITRGNLRNKIRTLGISIAPNISVEGDAES